MDIYRHDEAFRERGFRHVAGIDEAGRGPLAGPVVAAAAVLPSMQRIEGLRDSKKVPEKERESIFWELLFCSADIGVGIVDAETIDKINILEATRLAMEMAVKDLSSEPDLLLIDAVKLSRLKMEQVSLIKGESKSASISAASIIAKVVRDGIMRDYDRTYPDYGFAKHKGYSTREHMDKLAVLGPCRIHRKSFEKVMTLELPL